MGEALGQILAITRKELMLFLRDPGALALTFLMPLMFIVVMSLALAGVFDKGKKTQPIRILVVNEDRGGHAEAVIRDMTRSPALRVQRKHRGRPLSARQAERLVGQGGGAGLAIIFPAGFSAALNAAALAPREVRTRTPTRVRLVADPVRSLQFVEPVRALVGIMVRSRAIVVALPRQLLRGQALGRGIAGRGTGPAAPDTARLFAEVVESSARVARVERALPRGTRLTHYPDTYQQNVPGYAVFGMFWIVALLAGSVLRERGDGTLVRLRVAPIGRGVLLAGKAAPYLLINIVQIAAMLAVGNLLFGMDLGSSAGGLVLVALAAAAAATGLGVLVSALVRTQAQATSLTTLVLLVMAALGGCFIPRFIMPDWLQSAGLVTPHAWALDGLQACLVRGRGVVDVLPHVAVLLGFAAATFAAGAVRFRRVLA